MRTIGLLGGLSWVSTGDYYNYINKYINTVCGGGISAKIVIYSYNFKDYLDAVSENKQLSLLIHGVEVLASSGSSIILICSNTVNQYASAIQSATGVVIFDVFESLVDEICSLNLKKIGIIGTRNTLNQGVLIPKLRKAGVEVQLPYVPEQEVVDEIIYSNLAYGNYHEIDRSVLLEITKRLSLENEAILFVCTALPKLINSTFDEFAILDSVKIHSRRIGDLSLKP